MKSFSLKGIKFSLRKKLSTRLEFKSKSPLFLFVKIGDLTYINYCNKLRYSKKDKKIHFLSSKYIIIDKELNSKEIETEYLFFIYRKNIYHVSSDYNEINRLLKSMEKNKGLL